MKLYQIDTGARWYVAAPTAHQAVAVWAKDSIEIGAVEELLDELLDFEIVEHTTDPKVRISMTSDCDPGRLVWELAQEAREPQVICCSEWP